MLLTRFMPLVFLHSISPQNIRESEVLSSFQGVGKENSGVKWVNVFFDTVHYGMKKVAPS